MKTLKPGWPQTMAWLTIVAILSTGSVIAGPAGAVATAGSPVAPVPATPPAPATAPRAVIKIDSIEPAGTKVVEADATWLGVYAEEVSEALSSQLGLKSGEGLLIAYVAANSPAAKAGLQKHDVLVEMRDQLLVHPAQLVKLIRSQKDGETVTLAFYRQGKKQTVSATLTKRPETSATWPSATPMVEWRAADATSVSDGIHGQMKDLHEELLRMGADKQKVKLEVERSMEEARKALQDALRHQAQGGVAIGLDAKDLEALANGSVDIGENATVVVKKDGRVIRTIVQTDESGSYVIVAIPKRRLAAHDKEGKLLFDGEIETPEQQAKVPAELWVKVKPLLEQLKPQDEGGGKPRVGFDCELQS